MRQMLIKALTKQGFVKYLILPGAALHINSAFPELLYRSGQGNSLLTSLPTLNQQSLDNQPTIERSTTEK